MRENTWDACEVDAVGIVAGSFLAALTDDDGTFVLLAVTPVQ